MQEKWRLLKQINTNGSTQMAIDEAIMNSIRNNLSPATLRFYTWEPKCVTLGHMQDIKKEVDFDYCKNNNITIVQRITGGGCVLHHKELTYSFIVKQEDISKDIIKRFRIVCNCIINSFKQLGINAEFKPINDIIVDGKKISGNAQTTIDGVTLIHGTILLDVDISLMQNVLKNPKFKQKGNIENAITSFRGELNRNIKNLDIKKLINSIIKEFKESTGRELVEGCLSKQEKEDVEKLKVTRYKSLMIDNLIKK